ncbi:alpha/beta fold hydrolase [Dactylosporangium sp. NBC_01737]|uniref:alpha/beta fold hydrolase n=1 Tax=Dactylosporangium sp. NBC_01737 TaxID=2975959 RepID=UPI002E14C0D7|nr:alpha/beta fold hydrolase [Dactylosporangium sp. NBC_01737]
MRFLETGGARLCVETFGDPADPTILLVHGAAASMLWWDEELCELLAAGGRHVVRYDNRDTGRSTAYPPGRPGYTMRDMALDAIGILEGLGVGAAHLVGRSMAGGIVTVAAAEHPSRVATLTLVTTTPGLPGLPPMSPAFVEFTGSGGPDPADPVAVVEFIVGLMRVYGGGSPYFDEPAVRRLAERDVPRTTDIASCLVNHFVIDTGGAGPQLLAGLRAPTLVVHGERDPVFPLGHGTALRDAIPGASLLVLPGAGHELPRPLWPLFTASLLEHTARRLP